MSKWPFKKLKLFIMVVVLGVYGLFSWAWTEIQEPSDFHLTQSTSR